MAAANELIMVFIGLEISSIASYVLAGYLRDDKRNNESALKYFLLGSFATAFFLYGIAWIYGITGSTNLGRDPPGAPESGPGVSTWRWLATAAALMFVGFAFKVSARPFQIWAPDVYQGAPAPVTAFMSAGPKAAAFAILMRIFITAFGPIADRWEPHRLVLRAADHDHRQLRRAHAIEHQAPARLQLHRACRIRAGGHYRALRDRDCGGDVLPGRVCVHEHRRICGRDLLRAPGRALCERRRLCRTRLPPARWSRRC